MGVYCVCMSALDEVKNITAESTDKVILGVGSVCILIRPKFRGNLPLPRFVSLFLHQMNGENDKDFHQIQW